MTNNNIKSAMKISLIALGLAATSISAKEVQLPELQNQPAMSFSFALNQNAKLQIETHKVQTESNEYWMTVNANQLRAGLPVHTTVSSALIKVSRSDAQSSPLNAERLRLFAKDAPQTNIAGKVIGEQDLKTTGVFANATAIKMDESIAPGQFTLRYDGQLASDAQFVIHVKEKHANNKLQLSTVKQHALKGEALEFEAMMLNQDKTIKFDSIEAFVVSPSGKKVTLPARKGLKNISKISATEFAAELQQVEAPVNGLYELHINAKAQENGLTIKRTGKIAFALAEQTAKLDRQLRAPINQLKPQTHFALTVNEPGRYEVRGILYGHDKNGELKPIMETHAAQNFAAGPGLLKMEFDRKLLMQSDLVAPYVIKDVRLFDQTRLSRL